MSTLEIPAPASPEPPSAFAGMKMPIPKPGSIDLPRTERRRRAAAGTKIRVTHQLIKDVENALATGTPLALVADMVDIDRKTLGKWLRRGEQAGQKKWRERDQLDRMCLELREAVRTAQGAFAVRVIGVQAMAAGLTREKATETRTRRTIRNAKINTDGSVEGGQETEVVIETVEKAPDWKAAQALASMRFPEDLGAGPMEDDDTSGSIVTNEQLRARLDALRPAPEEDDDEDVVDAELVEEPEPEPVKKATKAKRAPAKKPR